MLTSLLLAALSLNSLAAFDTTKLPEHGTDIGGPTITSADQACHDMLVRAEDTLVRVEAYEAWRINDHQAKFACRDTHYGETGFHGVSTDGNWHFTCPPDKPFVHVALANSLQPGEPQHSKARCHKYKWPAGVYCVLDGNIFVKCRQNSVIFDAETCCRSRVQSQFYLGLHLIPMEAFNVSILTTSMYPFASNTKEDRASQATMELFCSDTRLDLVVDETVNPPVRWELSRRIFLVCERGYKPQLTYNVALIRPRIDYKGDLQSTTTKGACVKDDALYDEHGIPRKRVRWDMPSGKETEEAANVAKMASIDLTSSSRSKVMLSFDLNLPASEE